MLGVNTGVAEFNSIVRIDKRNSSRSLIKIGDDQFSQERQRMNLCTYLVLNGFAQHLVSKCDPRKMILKP